MYMKDMIVMDVVKYENKKNIKQIPNLNLLFIEKKQIKSRLF